MDLLYILIFWLSGQYGNPHVGADTGANAAAQAGRTFGPVFDPSLVHCQDVNDGTGGTWTMCVSPGKVYYTKDNK